MCGGKDSGGRRWRLLAVYANQCTCSVVLRVGVFGVGEADSLALGVEHGVEALLPEVAVDEVETLAAVRAEVRDDEVDAAGVAAECAVELHGDAAEDQCRAHAGKALRERGKDVRSGARSGRWR